MPYIPPQNRPDLDARVDALAEDIAATMAGNGHTAELSTYYRRALNEIAGFILNEDIPGDLVPLPVVSQPFDASKNQPAQSAHNGHIFEEI